MVNNDSNKNCFTYSIAGGPSRVNKPFSDSTLCVRTHNKRGDEYKCEDKVRIIILQYNKFLLVVGLSTFLGGVDTRRSYFFAPCVDKARNSTSIPAYRRWLLSQSGGYEGGKKTYTNTEKENVSFLCLFVDSYINGNVDKRTYEPEPTFIIIYHQVLFELFEKGGLKLTHSIKVGGAIEWEELE